MKTLEVERTNEPHWPSIDERALTTTYEQAVPSGLPEHRWVYLWHWPIRAMHWIAVFSILTLGVTGFYIGRPYFMSTSAQSPFTTQWFRLAHFIAAGALVMTAIVRAYWLFKGNRFERLPALFPVRGRDWKNLWKMIKYYLLIHPERAPRYLGHNPLQQMFYTITYAFAAVLTVTGFIMFGEANPSGWMMNTFGRLAPMLGGMQMVRVIHHVAAWYFPFFVVFHVYLAVRADLLERSGSMSSMISGGRFVPVEERFTDG
ncbi:MAG TPA: Ni/Fe-hydrogenase, b-type cytochrome subunit [Gemmatimonadaceae bacterium]|nr:Ni/Fe-hydrogenase, b-type cytochrome subunit [Gemmatimonadaceae bacterium]